MPGPMNQLVEQYDAIFDSPAEVPEAGHDNDVTFIRIIGSVLNIVFFDLRAGGNDELINKGVAPIRIGRPRRGGELVRQFGALADVEYGVIAQHVDDA